MISKQLGIEANLAEAPAIKTVAHWLLCLNPGWPREIGYAVLHDLLSRTPIKMELAQYPGKLSYIFGVLHTRFL